MIGLVFRRRRRRGGRGPRLTLAERRLVLRLGLRLLRPRGVAEVVSAVWVVVAAAVLLTSVFVVTDFIGSLNARQAVLSHRTPAGVGRSQAAQAGRALPWAAETVQNVGGAQLIMLSVSPRQGGVRLPVGMPRWPAPGEVIASPGAVKLLGENPFAAALVPGRVVAAVGRRALRDPDEAYVVVGRTREQVKSAGGEAIAGFGGSGTGLKDVTAKQVLGIAGMVSVVLAGGAAVLFGTVTRLASRARRRRVSVLQLMGASTTMLAGLAGVTTGVLAAVGAVVAGLAAGPVQRLVADIGVSGVRWWPGSPWSGWAVMLPIAVVTVRAMARVARRTVDRDPWARRRDAGEHQPSPWRLLPGFVGVCLLAGVLYTEQQNIPHRVGLTGSGVLVLLVALLSLVVAAPLSAPVITRAAGALVARSPWLTWRLAGARGRHHARSTARIAGSLMVLALVTGVAIGYWDIARTSYNKSASGVLDLSLTPQPGSTWTQSMAARILSRADLVSASVLHNPDSSLERLTRPEQVLPGDTYYSFILPAAAARQVAAQIERAHPGEQPNLFDHDMTGPYAQLAGTAAVVLALYLTTALVVLALAITLITLQHDRHVPDSALLMSGLSRARLRAARAVEIVISVLPGVLLALGVAWMIARGVSHIDDPTVAAPARLHLLLAATAITACAVLAAVAALATPALDPATTRRD